LLLLALDQIQCGLQARPACGSVRVCTAGLSRRPSWHAIFQLAVASSRVLSQ
jgi:hypothetical protein